MLIVADSSPLIALSICNGLFILERLYDEVWVPQAVYDEVIFEGKAEAHHLEVFLENRIRSVDLSDFVIDASRLGRGEREAMALCQKEQADLLLIDDKPARKVAKQNGIQIIGSLGVLIQAKRQGIIVSVKPFLDRLRRSKIRYSDRLIDRAIKLARE